MDDPDEVSPLVHRLIRASAVLSLIGLICVLLFLWTGFQSWSVGVGVFLGLPLLGGSIVMYVVAVVIDLRQRDVI